jgi:hypothetical protein
VGRASWPAFFFPIILARKTGSKDRRKYLKIKNRDFAGLP